MRAGQLSPLCLSWLRVSGFGRKQQRGTSKNRPYSSNATKLPANDSASFPFRFINVHSEAVSDRQRDQFFEAPNGANYRGPVVLGRTTPTMLEQRNANASHTVKPFRPREMASFDARAAYSEAIVAESKPGGSFQHVLSLHYVQQ